jgi:hypothetical protein
MLFEIASSHADLATAFRLARATQNRAALGTQARPLSALRLGCRTYKFIEVDTITMPDDLLHRIESDRFCVYKTRALKDKEQRTYCVICYYAYKHPVIL